jgi:serine-type D-Ala-D-Ala carboxypeptidase
MMTDLVARLATICEGAVASNETPGGVLLVGRADEFLCEFAFGDRSVDPTIEPATTDTIYDLASLTKPLVTATLVMKAVELGLLNLMEPLSRWLDVANTPLSEPTPRHLMLHVSGLPPGLSAPFPETREAYIAAARAFTPEHAPGEVFTYSDTGFILLGFILEKAFGETLDLLATRLVFDPLEMTDTAYGVTADRGERCAPTERVNGSMLRGIVHDPVARTIGGIAGHAGVFGTARDLWRYSRMILGRGELDGARILAPAVVDRMIAPINVPGGKLRSLGWDVDSQYSSPRGELLDASGVGHTGFTGTSMWIDPPSGLSIILLTNRVHPSCDGDVVRLRRVVANAVAAAVLD